MGLTVADASDRMYDVASGVAEGRRRKSNDILQQRNAMMDQLVKRAQLGEAGYDIQGNSIVQRPDFISAKQAQAKKDLAETDILEMKRDRMRRMQPLGGASPLPGSVQPLGLPPGYTSFIDPNTGDEKIVADKSQPAPMNDLQKVVLEEKRQKAEATKRVDENRDEMLRSSAEDNLKTIEEVKKGKKYFGPLGELPSVPVLTGDYNERKNWEVNVNKLLSQKVVDLMNSMKSASRTGATGFGQLNKSELDLLKNASTALKRSLAPEDAMRYLNDIEQIHRKVLGGASKLPSFASEADIPPGFKGAAIVGGVEGMVD